MPRRLSPPMMNAFKSGPLAPLLGVVHRDRDLILEIRDDKVDIYCKGQVAVHVEPGSHGVYVLSADKAFWDRASRAVASITETQAFVAEELPHIKQRIAEHRKSPRGGGLEIEFEQLLIRANTQEPGLNTEYFAIDRQVLVGGGGERIDVLGVCWPRGNRAGSTVLSPALIEVKYGLKGGVDGLADQLERYYRALAGRTETLAAEAEGILRQKVELGRSPAGRRRPSASWRVCPSPATSGTSASWWRWPTTTPTAGCSPSTAWQSYLSAIRSRSIGWASASGRPTGCRW